MEVFRIKKITNAMDWLLKGVMLLLVLGIILCVLLQVFYRYFFDGYLGWTEELARYSLAWTVFIGMGYSFGHSEHLIVDILTYKLSPKKAHVLVVAGWIVSLIFCMIMLYVSIKGYRTVSSTKWTTIPQLSYGLVYSALPTGLSLSIFYLVTNLIDEFIPKAQKGE